MAEEEDFVARYRREEQAMKMRQSATGVGIEFSITVAALCLAGWGVDQGLDTEPVFLLVGLGLGLVVAFYRLVMVANRMTRRNSGKQAGR